MKVVALSNGNLGLRYRAHSWALSQINVEVVHLAVRGPGVVKDKLLRQAAILRRKGPFAYVRWRQERRAAGPLRDELAREIEQRVALDPFSTYDSQPVETFSGFSSALVERIKREKPDYILQMGAGLIPEHFILATPPILNLHPGILPGIRGMDPTFWALYYGREDWLGSTLHLIDKNIDTGPPLLRRRLSYQEGSNLAALIREQTLMEIEMLRLFFENPADCSRYDHGGSPVSAYKSTWSRQEFERLRAAQWKGPVDRKYLRDTREEGAIPAQDLPPSVTAPEKPLESAREPNQFRNE